MLEPILAEFGAFCRTIRFSAPTIPYVSNLTGTWVTAADVTDPDYWVRHLRDAVRFSDGIATILADPNRVLLEIGPGRTLASLARHERHVAGDGGADDPPPQGGALRRRRSRSARSARRGRPVSRSTPPVCSTARTAVVCRCRRTRSSTAATGSSRTPIDVSSRPTARGALRKREDVADWFTTPVVASFGRRRPA